MVQYGAVQSERSIVTGARRLPGGRVQGELAVQVRANARHGMDLTVGAVHEPDDRAEVERSYAAFWKVLRREHSVPLPAVGDHGLVGRRGSAVFRRRWSTPGPGLRQGRPMPPRPLPPRPRSSDGYCSGNSGVEHHPARSGGAGAAPRRTPRWVRCPARLRARRWRPATRPRRRRTPRTGVAVCAAAGP